MSMSARLDMAGLSFSNADAAGSRAGEVGAATSCANFWHQFLAESHSNQPYSQILLFVLFFFCTLLQPLIEVNTAMEAASSTTQAHSGTDADDDSGGCGMFFLQKSAVKNDGCQ